MTSTKPIPYTVTRGANRPVIFVEMWAGEASAGLPGTGHLRVFDQHEWVRAACYIQELRAGYLSGKF